MGLRAGKLRHRVTLVRPVSVPDNRGGYVPGEPERTQLFAMVESMGGREALLASTMQGVSSYRITVRWRADLVSADSSAWQIELPDGRALNIHDIGDPDGKGEQLRILADTGSVVAEP